MFAPTQHLSPDLSSLLKNCLEAIENQVSHLGRALGSCIVLGWSGDGSGQECLVQLWLNASDTFP